MENAEASYGETKQEQHGIVAYGESLMNLALYDPPRWGWTAVGTIADLLPPHEVCLSCVCVSYVFVFEYSISSPWDVRILPLIACFRSCQFCSCGCCLVEITSSEHGSSISQAKTKTSTYYIPIRKNCATNIIARFSGRILGYHSTIE